MQAILFIEYAAATPVGVAWLGAMAMLAPGWVHKSGWVESDLEGLPTAGDVMQYLEPLARLPQVRAALHTNYSVLRVALIV